jgi:hypothetical protein
VQHADHAVEQVALRGGVAISGGAAAVVVGAGAGVVGEGGEGPDVAGAASRWQSPGNPATAARAGFCRNPPSAIRIASCGATWTPESMGVRPLKSMI